MTSHVGRLYALAGAVLVFFVLWASIAAHPWSKAAAKADPRIVALQAREQRVRAEIVRVKRLLDRRYTAYRVALARRERAIAHARVLIRARARTAAAQKAAAQRVAALASAPTYSAPAPTYSAPRVVTLPPLTVTRTS